MATGMDHSSNQFLEDAFTVRQKAPTRQTRSWAAVLGSSLPKCDEMNTLEVVLEKDTRGSFIVSENECFNLIRRLGLGTRPGINVEGVQIYPQALEQ